MKKVPILLCVFATSLVFGGTSGIQFVYQPLTTMGTDGDAAIIVAKIPIIANAVPESIITYISAPHKLQQREPAFADDSNLLSCLRISVSAEWIPEPRHYVATLDLSAMKPTSSFGITDEAVVESAIDCIRRTIDELGQESPWKIRIISREQDRAKWTKYETDYHVRPPK